MKRRHVARALALLLVAAVSFTTVGCGDSKTAKSSVSTNGAKTVADGADPQDLEPYTITWAYIGNTYQDTSLIEEEMNKILEPKFNCKIDIIGFSWGEYAQKLNLMLSGEEPLDLVPVMYQNGASYINNGQVIDMKELIDKYGINMKEVLGDDTLYTCSVDGKIYGVPVFKEYTSDLVVMMRKDLLEEAGYTIDDVESLEDLDEIYAAVQKNHPETTMLAGRKGETPGVQAVWCDNLSDTFGVVMPDDKTGTVVNYYDTDQFKQNAELMYEFAQKGYISKDCATMTEGKKPQVKAGTAFSYYCISSKPGLDVQDSLETGYEMVSKPVTSGFRATSMIAWMGWGIGRNCQYPERAMEVLDYMYKSPELTNLFNWGIEGKHYVFKDEEKEIITYPEGIDAQNKTYGLNIGFEMPNQSMGYVWEGNDPSMWDKMREFNSSEPLVSTGLIIDNANVLTEISALTNVRDKYIDAIGSGAVDPETAIPEMNKELEKAGLTTVIEEKQKQLDAFIAEKNKQ